MLKKNRCFLLSVLARYEGHGGGVLNSGVSNAVYAIRLPVIKWSSVNNLKNVELNSSFKIIYITSWYCCSYTEGFVLAIILIDL